MISYRQSKELGNLYIQHMLVRCRSFLYPIKDILEILNKKNIHSFECIGPSFWQLALSPPPIKEDSVFLANRLSLNGDLNDIFSPYLKKRISLYLKKSIKILFIKFKNIFNFI